jgi:HK97 gp10 family phage protein
LAKDGISDLLKDLTLLENKVRNKVIKQAQKESLKPLAEAIKQAAPVLTGDLKKSVKIKAGPRKKGYIVTVVSISTKDELAYVGYAEFGTRQEPAKPYIRPTVKAIRGQVVDHMVDALNRAVNYPRP